MHTGEWWWEKQVSQIHSSSCIRWLT
jgi:hypothetical protein